MGLHEIGIAGYRSIRELSLKLSPINILTGPNGCGKSNLYNSLVLIARAAQGQFSARHHAAVEGVGAYWHFVDLIWLLVFSTIFLIR